jgi:SAM-dependent methyltransferase
MEFHADAYTGDCCVCGSGGQIFRREHLAIRETYRCSVCRASLREREQARAIVELYGPDDVTCIAQLVETPVFQRLAIYEPGTSGPFRRYLSGLNNYVQSDYLPGDPTHQDLQCLTFPSHSFDLVISSDVLEHVRRPREAFSELYRVLRPGGAHIFTVPLQEPIRPNSVWRVDTSRPEDVYTFPPHYHGDGKGGRSLVYVDYGLDILDLLMDTGFISRLLFPRTDSKKANRAPVIVAVKLREN